MSITASNLGCVATCRRVASLPHADRVTTYSTRGTALHRFLADVPELGVEAALERVPAEHRAACRGIDLSRLPACEPDAYAVEVAYAYDWKRDSARELGRKSNRDYSSMTSTEIGGTPDVIGLMPDRAVVFDYKTGWADIASPLENWQLRTYALMVARCYGKDCVDAAILRVRPDGTVWIDRATFTADDLDDFAAELQDLMVAAVQSWPIGSKDGFVLGDHCSRCPALPFCPAMMGLAAAMVTAPVDALALPEGCGATADAIAAQITVQTFPSIWGRLKAASALIEVVDDACRMFARQTPVDLGNGTRVGLVKRDATFVDGGVVFRVLSERFGVEVADQAVEFKSSAAAIERAVRDIAKAQGVTIVSLKRDVLREVEERGGVRVTTSETVREHKIKGGNDV